jgi:hypothetical protein
MSRRRPSFEVTCPICNIIFITNRKKKVCCSQICAKRLWVQKKGKVYFRARYLSDPAKFIKYAKTHHQKLKDMCYKAYGGYKCACPHCSEVNPQFLTLDHTRNDGAELRKVHGDGNVFYRWLVKNGFPSIVQVLCYNCNCGKNVNGGVCPHFGDINARE